MSKRSGTRETLRLLAIDMAVVAVIVLVLLAVFALVCCDSRAP